MRLAEMLRETCIVEEPAGASRLPDLLRCADDVALPAGRVIEVPARSPRETLLHLEAAWRRGSIPVPSARARAPRVLDLHEVPPEVVIGLRTSGSTGCPRIAGFTAAALRTSAGRIADVLGLAREDRVAVVQSLDHGFGLVGQLLAAGAAGATIVSCARPYPRERAEAMRAGHPTVVAAVPFLLRELLEEEGLPPGVRQVGSAGARLPVALARRIADVLPRATLWNQYGCTEAGPRLCALPSSDAAFLGGSVGPPLPGVRLEVDPQGEVLFASDMAMVGYLDEETPWRRLSDGTPALPTGDLGQLVGGRLFLEGRTDELVKIRGERVSLAAVARAAEAGGARHAVALLLDDDLLGLAYEADEPLHLAALARQLPTAGVPRRTLRLSALPRLASGKVDRAALRGSFGCMP